MRVAFVSWAQLFGKCCLSRIIKICCNLRPFEMIASSKRYDELLRPKISCTICLYICIKSKSFENQT